MAKRTVPRTLRQRRSPTADEVLHVIQSLVIMVLLNMVVDGLR